MSARSRCRPIRHPHRARWGAPICRPRLRPLGRWGDRSRDGKGTETVSKTKKIVNMLADDTAAPAAARTLAKAAEQEGKLISDYLTERLQHDHAPKTAAESASSETHSIAYHLPPRGGGLGLQCPSFNAVGIGGRVGVRKTQTARPACGGRGRSARRPYRPCPPHLENYRSRIVEQDAQHAAKRDARGDIGLSRVAVHVGEGRVVERLHVGGFKSERIRLRWAGCQIMPESVGF